MKKTIITIAIILIVATSILLISPKMTGKTINQEKYLFTKAICDENNYCKDYKIECENGMPSKITPTGFAIQKPKNWIDKRNNSKYYCD